MAIEKDHLPYYQDVFDIPEFPSNPTFVFGYHDCNYDKRPFQRMIKNRISLFLRLLAYRKLQGVKFRGLTNIPEKFSENGLQEILQNFGVSDITVLDLFDSRADFQFDMNDPIPQEHECKYKTVIDIGSTEHVFDTRQCLSNLFNLVSMNGLLLTQTPCRGYYNHGLHTLSPECLEKSFLLNGFNVLYKKFSTPDGVELADPACSTDTLMWIVGKKTRKVVSFVNPQQGRWREWYD